MHGLDGPRGCRPDELDALMPLVDSVFGGQDMRRSFPTLFCASNAFYLRTFWDGAAPVSHVGLWRGAVRCRGRRLTVAHVGAVCTRPEYRRRGLAGVLMADALRLLHAESVALLLISGNRSLYRRIGARRFGRLLRYRVDRPAAARLAAASVQTAEPTPADCARLYGREPLRYERSERDWGELLAAKGYLPAAGGRRAVLAIAAEQAGHLLLGRLRVPAEGTAGPAVLPVDEFAGHRPAVVGALERLLQAAGADAADLLVQPGDGEMRRLLEAAGVSAEPAGHQGTARVLHVQAFSEALGLADVPPQQALGSDGEVAAAAALTERVLGPNGVELPRNDGLNYI